MYVPSILHFNSRFAPFLMEGIRSTCDLIGIPSPLYPNHYFYLATAFCFHRVLSSNRISY